MPPEASASSLDRVVSRREARLVFWLVVIALLGVVLTLFAEVFLVLATPAVILFVAWLLSYVLEPPVSFIQRHLPFRGRGVAVAITYLVTAVVAFVVIAGAGVAVINAAVAFTDNLPAILEEVGHALRPLVDLLGLTMPSEGNVVAAIQQFLAENASQIADAVTATARNLIVVVASLITAVIISVGLAMGQVSLLGWLRRFLPSSTYRDLTELERAIAVSFGGFVRGRLLIGAIYGSVIGVAATVLGIPYGALIAVIAGLIVFIPWIGPLIGWAVLPAFALILAPDEVAPAAAISIITAVLIQVVVTQFVMAGAVRMPPVAVFVVVIFGSAIAGILGAVFAIPTAAAILAVTDYLRQRDVLLRSEVDGATPADETSLTMPGTLAQIALVMFIGMGPIKVLVFYLDAIRDATPAVGRKVAVRAVLTATVTTLGLLLAGALLMRLLHFSSADLIVAGGIVLLAYGLQMVLSTTPGRESDHQLTEADLMRMAVYPMGVPLILNPAGIAAATIFSAEAVTFGDFGKLVLVVLAIAVLDLVVLFAARPVGHHLKPEATQVLEKLLGVLLVAVGLELILIGLVALGILDIALPVH